MRIFYKLQEKKKTFCRGYKGEEQGSRRKREQEEIKPEERRMRGEDKENNPPKPRGRFAPTTCNTSLKKRPAYQPFNQS